VVKVKPAPAATIKKEPTLIARAEAAVAAAAGHLRWAPSEPPAESMEVQLSNLRRRLEQRLELAPDATDEAATAELLISILNLQSELLDAALGRRARHLTAIGNALARLRGLSPAEMVHTAPAVLSHEFGFSRTMISTVRGSVWLPQHLHIANDGIDPYSLPFLDYVTGAQIQLADAPLETELVRKRSGALVRCPKEDKRTFKEIVDVSGSFGYIAAPITIQGRAIGMLHADRPEPDGIVRMDHLEQLEAFAECVAMAFESAVLDEKAQQQRLAVNNLCADVDELLRRSARSELWSMPGSTAGHRREAYHHADQPSVPSLTAREREIMSYVATGATNSQIARCLVISEGTVKSHLKHIARKLSTSSRAAAVAVFAGIATPQPSTSR
jgi:DNA-binding CsgD family transcriptional regulator/GAF domain-containing protein